MQKENLEKQKVEKPKAAPKEKSGGAATLRDFLKKRNVLIGICVLSAIAALLTVVLFSRSVFDCVTAEQAVRVTVTNTLSGDVYLNSTGDDLYKTPTLEIFGKHDGFYLSDTDDIRFSLNTHAKFTKPIKTSYTVSMKKEIIMRNSGGRVVPFHKSYEGDEKKLLGYGEPADLTSEINEGTTVQSIDFAALLSDITEFNASHANWSSAEIVITFVTKYINDETNKVIANVSTGVAIRIDNTAFVNKATHSYYFTKTGSHTSVESTFPPREIKMPGLTLIIGVTLLLGALAAAIVMSVRELAAENRINVASDSYRRSVGKILRKFSDEVVVARHTEFPSGTTKIPVTNFRELIKFSQHLSKPIIFAEIEPDTHGLFYILCDNMVYQYEVKK